MRGAPLAPYHPSLRVVVVCHAREIGGAERWLDQVLRVGRERLEGELHARFEFICRRDTVMDEWSETLAAEGIIVHRLDLRTPGHFWHLRRILRAAVLVHLNLSFPAGKYQASVAVAARLGRRRLLVSHHLQVEPEQLPGHRWVAFARWLGRLATAHLAVSASGAELLVQRLGYPMDRVHVIPTLVNLELFKPLTPARRDAARRELGARNRTQLIVTVARLNRQKGLPDLLEAAAMTAASEPDWRFMIVGEGELRASLEAMIASRGLRSRVALLGNQPPDVIARWMAAADVFVLPSHFEGLPMTLLEALACGCPVVATNVGGVPGLAIPAELGLMVPPHCPAGLVAGLRKVLVEVEPPVADAPRRQLLAPYEQGRVVGQVIDLYGRLLDMPPSMQLAAITPDSRAE